VRAANLVGLPKLRRWRVWPVAKGLGAFSLDRKMSTKRWSLVALGLAVLVSVVAILSVRVQNDWFTEYPFPLTNSDRLFDVGIVDANGDDRLDVFTSNHHFRQALLIADGHGGYRDVLSEWGLDQSKAFPLAELSFSAPRVDQPGIYIYWLGTNLIIQAHRIHEVGEVQGSLEVWDPVKVIKQDGFRASKDEEQRGTVTQTKLHFASIADGTLVLMPGGQGLPLDFDLGSGVTADRIFVGRGMVSPSSTRFSLAMRDRHAHAWADYNNDGVMDLFVNRGGLGGTIRAYPPAVVGTITDELFISRGSWRFDEAGFETGLRKNGCSGRHAKWVDFNGDGLLDLFVNCYDRENVSGDFPKQLYRQGAHKRLTDVAEEVGLDLPGEQMGSVVWFDVEGDGDTDLVAFQDEGIFLYRNQKGSFAQELVVRRPTTEGDKVGHTTESLWLFDGKLSAADVDGDGDLDLFSASKRGSLLLENRGGLFAGRDLAALGLPGLSMTANWVDFDNDGLTDLHLVPQGLYRQRTDGGFDRTGLLGVDPEQYQAAICNWFDLDNDGRQDLLMALDENPSLERPGKRKAKWQVVAYRNVGTPNHWLQVNLVGNSDNRQGIGARVTVVTASREQIQEVGASEGSFFSQGHYRLYFGLGTHTRADVIKIRWSDGSEKVLRNVDGGQLLTVQQGL